MAICRVEHLTGIWHIFPDIGPPVAICIGGRPVQDLGKGWNANFAYSGLSDFSLLELSHETNVRATWYLDSTMNRIAGSISQLTDSDKLRLARSYIEVISCNIGHLRPNELLYFESELAELATVNADTRSEFLGVCGDLAATIATEVPDSKIARSAKRFLADGAWNDGIELSRLCQTGDAARSGIFLRLAELLAAVGDIRAALVLLNETLSAQAVPAHLLSSFHLLRNRMDSQNKHPIPSAQLLQPITNISPEVAALLHSEEGALLSEDTLAWARWHYGQTWYKAYKIDPSRRSAEQDIEFHFSLLFATFAEFRSLYDYRVASIERKGLRGFMGHLRRASELHIACQHIGPRFRIVHGQNTIILAREIGADFCVHHGVTVGFHRGIPSIGNAVTVQTNALVFGDIVIGDDCIVTANALVTCDMQPATIAYAPSTLFRPRKSTNRTFWQALEAPERTTT